MVEALRNPDLGFVQKPREIVGITDFGRTEIEKLKLQRPAMVVIYTPRDPLHLTDIPALRQFLASQYGYAPEMSADEVAGTLDMRVARRWTNRSVSFELLTR
jgi:hypothetical protein